MSRLLFAAAFVVLFAGCHPNANSDSKQIGGEETTSRTDKVLDEQADVKVVPADQAVEQDQTIIEKPIKEEKVKIEDKNEVANSSMHEKTDDIATETKDAIPEDLPGNPAESSPGVSSKINKASEETADIVADVKGSGESSRDDASDKVRGNVIDPTMKSPDDKTADTSLPRQEEESEQERTRTVDHSHKAWDKMLKQYVDAAGLVNYDAWSTDMSALDEYITTLQAAKNIKSWSSDQQLAYWINSYNAHTVKLVLESYPVKSIKKITGGQPWKLAWIPHDGKDISLDAIENEIIRPQFDEPKIHFALVCAAISCPVLSRDAYRGDRLAEQLEVSTRRFMNSQWNQIGPTEMKLSPLFDWYAEDFGDIHAFVRKYSRVPLEDDAKISYTSYNWNLNRQ